MQLRKLTPSETRKVFPKRGAMDIREYVDSLKTLRVGDAASAPLEGLSQRALKRRFGQAAKSLNLKLIWERYPAHGEVKFKVSPIKRKRDGGNVLAF